MTDITNFDLEPHKLTQEPLIFDAEVDNSKQNYYNISVTLKGMDVKYIDITDFSWSRVETVE